MPLDGLLLLLQLLLQDLNSVSHELDTLLHMLELVLVPGQALRRY